MWPKNGNPEIARNLPRQAGLPQRVENQKAMAFNGIVYSDLLHDHAIDEIPSQLVKALEEYCEENDIKVYWGGMKKNYGNGGWQGSQLRIRMGDGHPNDVAVALTLVHEIVHCLGHAVMQPHGWFSWANIPNPSKEAEAYLVSYRVISFFAGRNALINSHQTLEEDFNQRLYWYGPKRNVQTIREEQCVEFADNLILWLIDRLGV